MNIVERDRLTVSVPADLDRELQALAICWGALVQLDRGEQARRVLDYLLARISDTPYGSPIVIAKPGATVSGVSGAGAAPR